MLWNVRLESLTDRYSAIWNNHFPAAFEESRVEYTTIEGRDYGEIKTGDFLDVVGTNKFKAEQTLRIMELFNVNLVSNSDVFFFHDLWHPALTSLLYIRDALGMSFKIAGLLHAGAYCAGDMLARTKMVAWAKEIEAGWFSAGGVDLIFTATEYHRNLVHAHYPSAKIAAQWFPLWFEGVHSADAKENLIVFPHRLTPERRPVVFDEVRQIIEAKHGDWKCVCTHDLPDHSRPAYLATLAKAKIVVSTTMQETWGIAVQEALVAGCRVVVPNAYAYPEYVPNDMLYPRHATAAGIASHVEGAMTTFDTARSKTRVREAAELVQLRGERAVEKMVGVMRAAKWTL